jgi:outer membrane protein assembly factor BamB
MDYNRLDHNTGARHMKRYCQAITTVRLAVLFLTSCVLGAHAAEVPVWPQFLGPNGSGVAAPEANPPIRFGPKENLIWKASIPSGLSSPCIWGDNIFLTGFDNQERKLKIFCLDRTKGIIRWSRDIPAAQIEQVHSISSPATATPVSDGERIYVYFGSFGLLAYNFEGELQWSTPLPIPQIRFGSGASPIILGDSIILNRDEQRESHVMVVNRKDGKIRWNHTQATSSQFGANSYSTPVVWGGLLVFHRMGEITAYSAEGGEPVWSVKVATNGESTPVVGDDTLFVAAWNNFGDVESRVKLPDFRTMLKQYDANGDSKISITEFPEDLAVARRPEVGDLPGGVVLVKPFWGMIDIDRNNLIDEQEWQGVTALTLSLYREHGLMAIRSGGTGDISATHVLWQVKTDIPEVPSPLYYDGRIYMVKNGGIVSCIDAKSGVLLNRQSIGAPGPYYASPVAALGRIYIASWKGVVTVLAAGEKPTVLAKNDLEEPILATPAIVETNIYIRTAKNIYAFGTPPQPEVGQKDVEK